MNIEVTDLAYLVGYLDGVNHNTKNQISILYTIMGEILTKKSNIDPMAISFTLGDSKHELLLKLERLGCDL
jgi:hypothetical protein